MDDNLSRVSVVIPRSEKIGLKVRSAEMDLDESKVIRALIRAFLAKMIILSKEDILELADLRPEDVLAPVVQKGN